MDQDEEYKEVFPDIHIFLLSKSAAKLLLFADMRNT
jgi:hypothetical protein